MKILSIDIGISNLGYVYAQIDFPEINNSSKYKNLKNNESYQFNYNLKVIDCDRVNITKVKHQRVKRCDCKLLHENCIPDYLDHFIQENVYFEQCDLLLIERQPPVGITNVQDLLFTKFRNKVLLISPNSVHKYFGLSSCYETRKVETEGISKDYLENFETFNNNIRKHDIADALCMILFYYKKELDKIINSTVYIKETHDFEQFRFNFLPKINLL